MRSDAFESIRQFFQDPILLGLSILLLLLLLIGFINGRYLASAKLWVLRRLMRVIFFALGTAYLAQEYFLKDTPFYALFLSGALAYILIDSLVYWNKLTLLNTLYPVIFPTYKEVASSWRPGEKFSKLKNDILEAGFTKNMSLAASVMDEKIMLTSFISSDKKIFLNVYFMPYLNTYMIATTTLSISENDDTFYGIDATYSPFGLSYPENYKMLYKPLSGGNPLKVLKAHKKFTKGKALKEINFNPLEMQTKVQEDIKMQSAHEGLFNAPANVEEFGVLSSEGLFRAWKSILKLNYLGFLK